MELASQNKTQIPPLQNLTKVSFFPGSDHLVSLPKLLVVGLRSGKIGEQCEAIVRFPRLFEKYPFPILINASFLKLADVFRVG